MNSTVAIVTFPQLDSAEKARKSLRDLEKQKLATTTDVVTLIKNDKGKLKVKETEDTTTAGGAAKGGVLGFVIGFMFGGPIGGMLVGGIAGALLGKKLDFGISRDKVKAVGENMPNGSSALLVQLESGNTAALRGLVNTYDGTVHEIEISEEAALIINQSAAAAHQATVGMDHL